MAAYNMKRVRGCMVLVLVFYTILVTYFLALTAWSDDVTEGDRGGKDDSLLSVLYQEERRHLRSFKDVIKSYGGLRQVKHHGMAKRNHGETGGERGGGVMDLNRQNFYVEGSISGHRDNNSSADSIDMIGQQQSLRNSNGSLGEVASALQASGPSVLAVDVESLDKSSFHKSEYSSDHRMHIPDTGNIIIEDNDPGSINNNKSKASHKISSSSFGNLFKAKKSQGVSSNQAGGKQAVQSAANAGSNNNKKNPGDTSTLTQYCDKLDAEEPHLCLSERITFSHRQHINISQNRLSFKILGDVYIYSAFLDMRRKPASIRLMVIGPKGRDGVKASGYWCAYTLPTHPVPQYSWTGRRMPLTASANQATKLDYYAASVGHNKDSQFYIMSCSVPEKHLSVLLQSDSNRIHLIVGGKDSPLLETAQQRIAVDVVNNQGLPWHLIISSLSKEGNGSDVKNSNTQTANISNITANSNSKEKNVLFSPRSPEAYPSSPIIDSIVSCVAPVVANIGIIPLIEFLELTLLLGSHHIVLYMGHMSKDIRDVLSVYQNKGLVSLLPWSIPDSTSIWANGRDVALNDCLYRTMYRYEYALFHDIDEFFVPRVTPDIPSFINFLKSKGGLKPNKISDIVFSSAYFSPPTKLQLKNLATLSGYSKEVSKFSTLRSIQRTYFSPQHTLRIIRPVMANRVGAGERKKTCFNISPRYAGVNHYSQCVNSSSSSPANTAAAAASAPGAPPGSTQKDPKSEVSCNSTKADMFLWRVKDRLIRQTKQSIREINAKRRA